MHKLAKKVRVACVFGSPSTEVTHEIVSEVEMLVGKLDEIRAILDRYQTDEDRAHVAEIEEVLNR